MTLLILPTDTILYRFPFRFLWLFSVEKNGLIALSTTDKRQVAVQPFQERALFASLGQWWRHLK